MNWLIIFVVLIKNFLELMESERFGIIAQNVGFSFVVFQ
jgi:hypothetical protein